MSSATAQKHCSFYGQCLNSINLLTRSHRPLLQKPIVSSFRISTARTESNEHLEPDHTVATANRTVNGTVNKTANGTANVTVTSEPITGFKCLGGMFERQASTSTWVPLRPFPLRAYEATITPQNTSSKHGRYVRRPVRRPVRRSFNVYRPLHHQTIRNPMGPLNL